MVLHRVPEVFHLLIEPFHSTLIWCERSVSRSANLPYIHFTLRSYIRMFNFSCRAQHAQRFSISSVLAETPGRLRGTSRYRAPKGFRQSVPEQTTITRKPGML